MFRKENGVTLVALVVTIVVLLVLAGVTISMVLGDDGIITNAQNAAAETEKADLVAAIRYADLLIRSDIVAYENGLSATYKDYTAEEFAKAIKANSEYKDDKQVKVDTVAQTVTVYGKDFYVPAEVGITSGQKILNIGEPQPITE